VSAGIQQLTVSATLMVPRMQDAKPPDVNEVLLLDSQGGVLEGMSSNVFMVRGGHVVTPDKGILVGTVRNLVLEVGT
jgi:branched-chain amino acid aminotransferase